jgi:hypothetical protein
LVSAALLRLQKLLFFLVSSVVAAWLMVATAGIHDFGLCVMLVAPFCWRRVFG